MRIAIANLIHEHNDACHMNVPKDAVCSRCDRIAKHIMFLLSFHFRDEALKKAS